MRVKQIISLITLSVMILGLLSGCGGGAEPVSSTPEELVATLDISETWKQELLHAARLGMPMGKVQKEKISGAEMMELLDWFVEYAKPEALDDWKNQLPLLRESNAALSRFDAMAAWYLAAQVAGRDYLGHNYSIMEMMDSVNHRWDENYITWEFFDDLMARISMVEPLAQAIWTVPAIITILLALLITVANIRLRWTRSRIPLRLMCSLLMRRRCSQSFV